MTRAEAIGVVNRAGHKVRLEFDTQTAQVDGWKPMTIGEFMAYATGLVEGRQIGVEQSR